MSYTDTLLDQAEQAIKEERLDDAHAILSPILEAEPHNPRVWAVLADATQDAAEAAGYRAKVVELARAVNAVSVPIPVPVQHSSISTLGWIMISLVAISGIFCAFGWISGAARNTTSNTTSQAPTVKVTYSVTGSKGRYVNLTYTNASGGTEQVSKRMPWTETLTVKRGEHLYLSAQSDSVATSVTCLIIANDQKVQEASSSGDYVIASCSGLAR